MNNKILEIRDLILVNAHNIETEGIEKATFRAEDLKKSSEAIYDLIQQERAEAVRENLLSLRSILLRNPETSELYKFLLEMIDSTLYEIEFGMKQKGEK